ncbi:MAG: LysE family translocator [Nevskiaceae bacterium]|nr:MAG: LysE family translocator [Nevskiaceae bacterium]
MSASLTLFLTVALAHLLAVMSPGPDFAMVTRQTLAHGRGAGLWTALGIGSGISFHVAWAMFGMGWVVARFPWLLDVLRYGGALFLLYMGSQAIRAQPANANGSADAVRAEAGGPARLFAVGVLTNILNPKALLFFMALCSAVITGATPVWLRVALGVWMAVSTAAWFSVVSLTLGHPRVRQRLLVHGYLIDRAMGAVLLALGIGMIVSGFIR